MMTPHHCQPSSSCPSSLSSPSFLSCPSSPSLASWLLAPPQPPQPRQPSSSSAIAQDEQQQRGQTPSHSTKQPSPQPSPGQHHTTIPSAAPRQTNHTHTPHTSPIVVPHCPAPAHLLLRHRHVSICVVRLGCLRHTRPVHRGLGLVVLGWLLLALGLGTLVSQGLALQLPHAGLHLGAGVQANGSVGRVAQRVHAHGERALGGQHT